MANDIIEVKNISVKYILGDYKDISLKEYLIRKIKKRITTTQKLALQNINFTVKKGEILGIVGSNGSGKSTLLKVISHIMLPTSGSVIVRGKVAPLLELGAGFDGELTIKENIFLRGALLGFSEQYMKDQYDNIIEFSELIEYENVPFKKLSSGMRSRLAFAIGSMVKPDILILDEVLSVGDIRFKKKSEDYIKKLMQDDQVTVLFVSHSINQIRTLCTRAIWIEQSKMMDIGDVNQICDKYVEFMNKGQ